MPRLPFCRVLPALVLTAASALCQPRSNPCPDAGGPTVANGMLYVNSGYGRMPGQPGNVLLAFSVEGK